MPTTPSCLSLTESPGQNAAVVRFNRSNLSDPEAIAEFHTRLDGWVEEGKHRLLISFDGVTHMSSAMLGELINVRKSLSRHGGQLRLCCLSRNLAEVFKITNLTSLFKIHPDEQDALAAFL